LINSNEIIESLTFVSGWRSPQSYKRVSLRESCPSPTFTFEAWFRSGVKRNFWLYTMYACTE